MKKKDGSKAKEWVSLKRYPSTLPQAIEEIMERSVRTGSDLRPLSDAVRAMDEWREKLDEALELERRSHGGA